MFRSSFTLFVSGLVAMAFIATASAEVRYTLTDLGVLAGYSESHANGVNAAGQVVGTCSARNGTSQPFVYSGGVLSGIIPNSTGAGYAINNREQIAGTFLSSGTGFVYAGGTTTLIGTLGGVDGRAYAINDLGQVAGSSTLYPLETVRHACLYTPGRSLIDLGTLGGRSSHAMGINQAGQVVGESDLAAGGWHAFLYANGKMNDLGTLPGGNLSAAYAVNASGSITGFSQNGTSDHAFLYTNGVMQDLGTLPGYTRSSGRAINSYGDVVGFVDNTNGGPHAMVYQNGLMRDLNTLVDPASGWTLTHASGINDRGDIVGTATNAFGQTRAFLLNPVPEPGMAIFCGAWASAALLSGRPGRREKRRGRAPIVTN